ncbi:MAG: GNAT family N-acyltransferase [Pseudoxanthomonas sp.]
MPPLEDQIIARFPQWFGGRRARLLRPLLRGWGRWSGVERAIQFLQAYPQLRDWDFVDAARSWLRLDYAVEQGAAARIPARGGLLIVANHPCGARDALALLDLVGQVRRDVRVVANEWLVLLQPLRGLLLPVRVFGGGTGAASLRAVRDALRGGACVIVFPAGEVSRLGPRGVSDRRWNAGFLHFARTAKVPVLPVRVKARNSALFYGASALFAPLGTALLPREALAARRRRVSLHVGQPLQPELHDQRISLAQVRRAVYALGRGRTPLQRAPQPLALPADPHALAAAIAALQPLGSTHDGKRIVSGRLDPDGVLMGEVGRLRELTFRRVGEGSGRSVDIDRYDAWYEHILLWDAPARRIVGAYRVAEAGAVLAARGLDGLYTASQYDYAPAALARLRQGAELGRSFVVPDYWGSRSIDMLWQGIGAWLARRPQVRWLYGAASMSQALPLAARERIVAYYRRYFAAPAVLATARTPFRFAAAAPDFGALQAEAAFALLRAELQALGVAVPTLMRQYAELCEPGGTCFLAFGVDADFGSVDGLIELDLARMLPSRRKRYLGRATTGETA